jgi:hypothetical protein
VSKKADWVQPPRARDDWFRTFYRGIIDHDPSPDRARSWASQPSCTLVLPEQSSEKMSLTTSQAASLVARHRLAPPGKLGTWGALYRAVWRPPRSTLFRLIPSASRGTPAIRETVSFRIREPLALSIALMASAICAAVAYRVSGRAGRVVYGNRVTQRRLAVCHRQRQTTPGI